MRLFQNSGVYASYLTNFNRIHGVQSTFDERKAAFLKDRYNASHFLKPILDGDISAFFTNGDDKILQLAWAREHGMASSTNLEDILLAQIEDHRTEVFYNLDPMRYGSDFIARLPGSVKRILCWRAAPSPGADFSLYHSILCNFPMIIRSYRERGWRSDYFLPGHDYAMDGYANNLDRPIDVLFVGGYTRHHKRRAELLEKLACELSHVNLRYHIDTSRLVKLSESYLGRALPLSKYRRPKQIISVSAEPVFGRALYEAISQAKIVLNGAIDMAGDDRGNMRCFEAMGCGALMISDAGKYPAEMQDGVNMVTYTDPVDAVKRVKTMLNAPEKRMKLASAGAKTMREKYSKERQWRAFISIVESL